MARVLARSLSKKKIVTNEGKVIGTLKNLIVDLETGQVVDMTIHPDPSYDTTGHRIEGGILFITFEAVKAADKDNIVVDRYLSRK
jgi:sporulation protein YlmC with PRC-barrel domain